MHAMVWALALFGCSDDATHCARLIDKAEDFTSRSSCEMSIDRALGSDLVRRADYPLIIGYCMQKAQWLALGSRPVDLSLGVIRLAVGN